MRFQPPVFFMLGAGVTILIIVHASGGLTEKMAAAAFLSPLVGILLDSIILEWRWRRRQRREYEEWCERQRENYL